MDNDSEKKPGTRRLGIIVFVVIIILISLFSRLFKKKNNNSDDIFTNKEYITTEQSLNDTNNIDLESMVSEYYGSVSNYLNDSTRSVDYIMAYYPERYNNSDIRQELTEELKVIKDNNIALDSKNGHYLIADVDPNRIALTDSHYIISDFIDVKLVIVNIPLISYGTDTDASLSSEISNNVLIANYKGNWYVIPSGHYYFE